ncbi:S-adenosylmethionine transporter [Malassezia sp. CBS 17886]|nr:S-adenosylmethionine transporter [Malassezia sp. CBS 17886]
MQADEADAIAARAPSFSVALAAGAAAGLSVDMLFYPIDTIKTRLQSAPGFWKSGGFAGVYRGMGSVAVGSAPGASIFFVTYETLKVRLAGALFPDSAQDAAKRSPSVHMGAASIAEVAACLVRVPTEVVKSRQQTSAYGRMSSPQAFVQIVSQDGIRGLYRGFGGTVLREFPLYEYLRHRAAAHTRAPTWWESAGAGSIAGSIAAGLTTPLDVIKTRIMLAKGGAGALFAGVVPRVIWIGFGGAVFLGTFDAAAKALQGPLVPAKHE